MIGKEKILLHITTYVTTAIGLTLGGSNTVHIYTQMVHRTQITNLEDNN